MPRTIRPSGDRGREYELRHPWPEDAFVQAGCSGLVITRDPNKPSYLTAFFEAFPSGTFIRGQGETIEDAEDAAWVKHVLRDGCPEHEWRNHPKGNPDNRYTNGAGFCQRCNRFESNRFTGEQLGQHCVTCDVGTTYAHYGPLAEFNWGQGMGLISDPSPEDQRVWYCEPHAPFRKEVTAYFQWLDLQSDQNFREWYADHA